MERKLTVKEFMGASLVTFYPDQEIKEAIQALLEYKLSGSPVVDNRGNLVGYLSEKDCLKVALNAAYHDHWGGKVSDFMVHHVKTVDLDMDIIALAEKFLKDPYKRYPVVKGNRLVGQIHRRDVLRALLVAWSQWGH
ncbi:MAG: CBS domain-containing protein [Nitrospirales bacterium]